MFNNQKNTVLVKKKKKKKKLMAQKQIKEFNPVLCYMNAFYVNSF